MRSATDDRFVGRTLPGGYHILDLISVGGMGRVYRAEQSMLGRTVAVKIIHPHLLSDENSAVRFLTEARAASQLNHPNSIAVFDFGRTDDGQPYIVMEFLRGKDLARVAYEEGPLPFARIVDVLRQVLAALGEAHDLGIIHRDLKPENIVLAPLRRGGDFVKVLDFGLAKLKADTANPGVTSPGIVCGTPDYMAPEQGRGDPIDGRSDLYALGVVLFQLLTGRLPFEAESPTQVVMMHLSIPIPDPRQVAPERGIPATLVDVTLRALEKDPARRYQDAAEFSDSLRDALDEAAARPSRISHLPSGAPAAPAVVCPTCGHTVPTTKFCGECGAPLAAVHSADNLSAALLPLPMVGREDDISWLEERRREADDAAVGARLVAESGAGKTRLMNEFANRVESAGDFVVRASPDPYWAEVAYHTVREVILELTGQAEQTLLETEGRRATAEVRRGLEIILSGMAPRSDRRSPVERRHAVAEALRWAAIVATEHSGARILLCVDELHRVDVPSRQAIADLLADPPRCSLLVLATHVPGFDSGWGSEHPARIVTGLSPPAATRLIPANKSGDRVRALDGDGRGIMPMYVEQLVRHTQEIGGDPPPRLVDLIAQRIDFLEQNARILLQALAVLGDRVDPKLLGKLVPKQLDVGPILETLEGRGMIERAGALISTAHPLLHEIVLLGTPAAVRRDLHTKALRIWEKRTAPLEVRALHAYHANEAFSALLLLEQVAERAASRGDLTSEILALRRGLELARHELSRGELDDPLQAMLIFGRKLGAALARSGAYADAEGVLREALDIAGPSSPDRARVLGVLAEVAHGRQRSDEALTYLDQAIDAARQSGANQLESTLHSTRAAWEL
ncbi:MAG: protein kinase [Polyangiaceae bacterium]|nr:protein kinase [Polyangiaceae bacterium]